MKLSDFRPIFLVNGILLLIVAVVMLVPALVDYLAGNPDWKVFSLSAIATGFIGGTLYLTNRGYNETLSLRQTFLFTGTCYFVIILFSAIPLYYSGLKLSFVDAVFEVSSGYTTTGSTVIVGLDHAPPGILLWRSLITGLGGIGMVVLTLAILPTLQIGGMQLFRTESSDRMDKMLPRATQIASTISIVFCCLTALCAFCYYLAGMSGFEAICNAIPTIATAGLATRDASFGYYNSALIEFVSIIFMLSGALPLLLYYQAVKGDPKAFWRDSQVRVFFGIVAASIAIITLWATMNTEMSLLTALRHTSFAVVTIVSTTGFTTVDYSAWGHFPTMGFFMLLVMGGCTGSTTGGIKVFRYQVFYETVKVQIRRLLQPHGVFIPRYNGRTVSTEDSASVMSFFLLWAFVFMVMSLGLSFFGLDFLTSMSAVAQAMANVGPGLGPVVGPATNYASIPEGAKLLLAIAMVLGRLELFTLIVLFSPYFWRD